MCRKLFLLFLLLHGLSCQVTAQTLPHGPELRWSLAHPFAALKIKHKLPLIRQSCQDIKAQQTLDTFISGGKLDAFRHTYAMAYLSQHISIRKLRKLGIAHEKVNYSDFRHTKLEDTERADSLACAMDLLNNELGFKLGRSFRDISPDSLKTLVIEAIRRGDASCLKRNVEGKYVRCDGTVLLLADYKGIWYIPKCLIKSNE